MQSSNENISTFAIKIPIEIDQELIKGKVDKYDSFVRAQLSQEIDTLLMKFSEHDQKHKEAFVNRFMQQTEQRHSILSALLEDLWAGIKKTDANKFNESKI